MKKIILSLIFVLGIVSIYFLGSSITGYIVSETCCFPPNCNPENQCKFSASEKSSSLSVEKIIGGVSLLLISIALYGLWHHNTNNNRNSIVRKR